MHNYLSTNGLKVCVFLMDMPENIKVDELRGLQIVWNKEP
jgi:hypothetical protein